MFTKKKHILEEKVNFMIFLAENLVHLFETSILDMIEKLADLSLFWSESV